MDSIGPAPEGGPPPNIEPDPDRRTAEDAAIVLPAVTAALLMPPLVLVFAAPVTVGGMPLIVVYVFGVWMAAILAAVALTRRLPIDSAGRRHTTGGGSGRRTIGPG